MNSVNLWGWLLCANIIVALFSVFVCVWAVSSFSNYEHRESELKAQYTKELQRVSTELNDRWTLKLDSAQSQMMSYVQTQVPMMMKGYTPTINNYHNTATSNGNTNGSVNARSQ